MMLLMVKIEVLSIINHTFMINMNMLLIISHIHEQYATTRSFHDEYVMCNAMDGS